MLEKCGPRLPNRYSHSVSPCGTNNGMAALRRSGAKFAKFPGVAWPVEEVRTGADRPVVKVSLAFSAGLGPAGEGPKFGRSRDPPNRKGNEQFTEETTAEAAPNMVFAFLIRLRWNPPASKPVFARHYCRYPLLIVPESKLLLIASTMVVTSE